MSIKKPKPIYKSAVNLREVDLSERYPDNCGKTILLLRDFTAGGENFINPHPHFLKYYSVNCFWVQILDEDDWIGQMEFSNLSEAQKLFEDILNSKPKDIYNQLKF